jgi:hypothetical protein
MFYTLRKKLTNLGDLFIYLFNNFLCALPIIFGWLAYLLVIAFTRIFEISHAICVHT